MSTTKKYVNPASNISYTAKDFQTIFPDLLTLTKELTSRWDPSISNESDPGVVLLELNAILADKLNYNIDKNILEAFPLSLTQMSSARKIYSLLGYRMKWYQSAWCDVNITWLGDIDESNYVIIPTFTTITDESKAITYTLVCLAEGLEDGAFNPNDNEEEYIKLPFSNKSTTTTVVRAIQGQAMKYDINGEKVIKVSSLDSNNRLYFSSTNIPENGVFIKNTGSTVYDWTRVDNLFTEKLGNKYFEFGVTDDLYSCYIEFPEDAEDLIKDGIEIVYIVTDGVNGNVSAGTLSKFSGDLYVLDHGSTQTQILLTTDNVSITNYLDATGGKDPETINEAYRNYRYLVGTFDTLVTLRDYMNAIMQTGLVSNCFVCDSTNDVQTTYTVKAVVNGIDTDEIQTESVTTTTSTKVLGDVQGYYKDGIFYEDSDYTVIMDESKTLGQFCTDCSTTKYDVYYHNETDHKFVKINNDIAHTSGKTDPAIDSISVKLYLLEQIDPVNNSVQFAKTFTMLENQSLSLVKTAIENNKHIGINYSDMLPTTDVNPRPCMFKNKYLITARIYPTSKLIESARSEIKKNIMTAFYNNLNASQVIFGESVQLDNISSIIANADDRIKTVYVDSVNYDTYAVYYTEVTDEEGTKTGSFYETKISDKDSITFTNTYVAPPLDNRKVYKKGDIIYQSNGRRYRCLRNNVSEFVATAWAIDEYNFSIDYDTFVLALEDRTHPVGNLNYGKTITFYTGPDCKTWYRKTADDKFEAVVLSDYGITHTEGTLYYNTTQGITNNRDSVTFQISKATQIRDYVFAKSILAGKTPLIEKEETDMDFSFLNPYVKTYKDVAEVEGLVDITFSKQSDYKYTLRNNELIQFYAPQFDDISSYTDYTKFEYEFKSPVGAGSSRQLTNGEWIAFYATPTTNSSGVYDYHVYSEGTIINLSFDVAAGTSATQYAKSFLPNPGSLSQPGTGWKKTKIGGHQYIEIYTNYYGIMPVEVSNNIKNITSTAQVLVDSKTAKIQAVSNIEIDNSCYCYWILNSKTSTDGNRYNYILFGKNDTQRILGNGEYFIYTDGSLTQLYIYGQGTKISRTYTGTEIRVSTDIDYQDLFDTGAILTSGKFYVPPVGYPLICTKNKSTYLSENCKVWLSPKNSKEAKELPTKLIISKSGTKGWLISDTITKENVTKTDTSKHIALTDINTKLITITGSAKGSETAALFNLYSYSDNTYTLLKENISTKTGYEFTGTTTNLTLAFEPLTSGIQLTVNVTVSKSVPKPLDYFDIKYSADGEADYSNSLDSIDDLDEGWEALSMLQLIFSSTSGQVLVDGQRITIYGDAWDNVTETGGVQTINGTTINGQQLTRVTIPALEFTVPEIEGTNKYLTRMYQYTQYPITAFSNSEIHTSTSGKTDITAYDDNGNPQYSNISIGRYNYSSSPLAASTLTEGGLILSITAPEDSTSINANSVIYPVQLMPGDYITRLTSSSSELSCLRMHFLCAQEVRIIPTGSTTYTISSKPTDITRIYYIEDDINETATINLYTGDLFECCLKSSRYGTIERETPTKLEADEYVIVYHRDVALDLYRYDAYGEGTVVNFTFDVFTEDAKGKSESEIVRHDVAKTLKDSTGDYIFTPDKIGSIESPKSWTLEITQRHYNVEYHGIATESESVLIGSLKAKRQYVLDENRTCNAGIPTDALREVYLSDDEPKTYTYDNKTGIVTFKKAPATVGCLIFVTSNLKYIPGSDITTMYTKAEDHPDLHNCNKTPVIFTIDSEYDPETYELPIYIAAKITLRSGLSKLNSTETITIGNPEKYIYNSTIMATKINTYKQLVQDLDTKKIFNYTYTPTEEELIENPLLPASFLNSNHPFNKCTICEYIGTSKDLDVVEKE